MNFEDSTLRTAATLLVAALSFLLAASAEAQIQEPVQAEAGVYDEDFFAQVDGHVAGITDDPNELALSGGVGYALRAGWRWGRWGVFGEGGQAAWFSTGLRRDFAPGVLNLGVGGEYRFHDGKVRSSFAGGTSTLLFDTVLDDAGSTGWYLNLRPAGLRWALSDSIAFELNPITFMVMQPVTVEPRITKIEYQAVLALEFQ